MNALDILVKAKELLSDPNKWYRGYFAVNDRGQIVASGDTDACKWCMVGALRKVSPAGNSSITNEAENQLEQTLCKSVPVFNDARDTTHQDVMHAFDRAIVDALNNQK